VAVGTTGDFEILSVDLEKKRIGVALVEAGSTRSAEAVPRSRDIEPGARLTGKIDRIEPFGVFVFLAPGRTGLIPMSETGVANDADVAKAFPLGTDVEVIVLDVDSASRRIRLSRKAVAAAQEAEEMREYTERRDRTPAGSFGSLADKLKGALGSKR
jgi:ribosomal protein S1